MAKKSDSSQNRASRPKAPVRPADEKPYPPYEINFATLASAEQHEGKFGFGHRGSHSVVVKATKSGKVRISYTHHSSTDLLPTLMVVIADAESSDGPDLPK